MIRPHKGNALVGILATIAVLLLMFVGLGVAFGWVSMSDSPDKSTIELNKVEMKEDTDQAVKATEKFIKESAEQVEQATEETSEKITGDTDEQETITPIPEETQPQPVDPEKDASQSRVRHRTESVAITDRQMNNEKGHRSPVDAPFLLSAWLLDDYQDVRCTINRSPRIVLIARYLPNGMLIANERTTSRNIQEGSPMGEQLNYR